MTPFSQAERRRRGSPHEAEVRHRVGYRVEDEVDLQGGQGLAEAEVRASAAEAEVRVGVAGDVEDLGALEHLGVVVGGGVEDADAVALLDLLPAQFGVLGRGALEGDDGVAQRTISSAVVFGRSLL